MQSKTCENPKYTMVMMRELLQNSFLCCTVLHYFVGFIQYLTLRDQEACHFVAHGTL
jgi:hypothetical protein